MKKEFQAICLFTFLCLSGFSQQAVSSDQRQIGLKFSPAGLLVGKITLGGEYNFKPRHSVTFHAGIPFSKAQTIRYDGSDNRIRTESFSVLAGYRYYISRKAMNGFYVEPYAKYLTNKSKGLINGTLNGEKVVFDSHSDFKGIGAGAQLGVQFIIGKVVLADLFLIGPEANSVKFSSSSTDVTNNMLWSFADEREAEKDIRDVFDDIPVVGDRIEVKVDRMKKNVSTSFSGFSPGFRIGASVGIRF